MKLSICARLYILSSEDFRRGRNEREVYSKIFINIKRWQKYSDQDETIIKKAPKYLFYGLWREVRE